jgi:hypothetical protein
MKKGQARTRYMIDAHDPIPMPSLKVNESPIGVPATFLLLYFLRFTMSLRLQSPPVHIEQGWTKFVRLLNDMTTHTTVKLDIVCMNAQPI